MRSFDDLLQLAWSSHLAPLERTKLIELMLRMTPSADLENLAIALFDRLGGRETESWLPELLRELFNEVSLTPYTDFVSKTLEFLRHLVRRNGLSVDQHVDFLGYLLRQVGRHLTAYDLVTFHHRGANYPDALLLDAVLKEYLGLIERYPNRFHSTGVGEKSNTTRMRRRALRQAWYFRRHYQGHPVTDVPTSPGENLRCMPPQHPRVSEEQINDTSKRTRHLYDDDPIDGHLGVNTNKVLQQSFADLQDTAELRELGMATFLDRPFGRWKRPGEPDQTPLLSYAAFSRSIARRRLHDLASLFELGSHEWNQIERSLDAMTVAGEPVNGPSARQVPGRVSITDAYQVAADFVIMRTTKRSIGAFLEQFDWSNLHTLGFSILNTQVSLIIGSTSEPMISLFDHRACRCVDLGFDPNDAFRCRGGLEIPARGLRVLRVFDAIDGNVREHGANIAVLPLDT
jgi:hypothetical protein